MKALWLAWLKSFLPKKAGISQTIVVNNPAIKVKGCYWEKEPSDAALQFMGVIKQPACCQCGACPGGCVAESKP